MYSISKVEKKGCGIFKHKKFNTNDNREKIINNLLESSQVGINLIIAISNSGKTTYLKNMLDSIIEPFRKKKDNSLYNRIKDKEIFFFFITTTYKIDPKITKIIDDLENIKHPIVNVMIYDKFTDKEYNEINELLEGTEKDEEFDFPQNIIIFDDARQYLKSKNLSILATKFRHHQALCFLSCHDFKDTPKNVRDNSFYITLYKNISDDRLREIHSTFIHSIKDFELFNDIYNNYLSEKKEGNKGDFIFIDVEKQKIYKNNEYLIEIKEKDEEI